MLETKKVFIDTQYFVKSGLHFDTPAFESFKKYCNENKLSHVSTTVVEWEVKSKIEISVKEALSAMRKFRRKARLLSSLDNEQISGLFSEIPEEYISEKSQSVFENFMSECSTKIIKADRVNAEDVLTLYFDKKPPFGEAKKKAEFPDAISLLSIKSYLQEDEKIYVVSDDGDLKAYCATDPQLISVETLDKVLDIYTTHTNKRHEQVKRYFTTNEADIKAKITEYLEGCDVWNLSSWEDAEVDDGLTVINLSVIEPLVLYIDDKESQITFDIDVEFEVTVTGPDFNNGIYDKEEQRIYTFDSTSRTRVITNTFTAEIHLNYDFIDGKLENTEDEGLCIVEASKGIEVSVEENEPDD
ncbi:hypothetical protein BTHERMOSOX_731 [Bathymodiolus thermophilus thioautotrophic gill symbiont]|uniref:PIN domain-containing protein n=1 Tax=Bathymodiolus thermophilus thioautotrophic gill symbiont TaxID=2360 RepID=UPI0010B0CB22|nr:PIN domain-containing protein [Bathymodiolus thermophilus thioautotrophic gill symbiont]SHA03026.1 hypothetical protein BTHERMOSOX_731 [Bathymodiolus thermophilus thioautotrophic gill symbiont]